MRKIAIRLGILVFTMILGVLVFIWYRSIQPPGLLSLLPNDVKAAGFIDTRNIIKKAFKSGANELVGLEFPEMLAGVFALAQYAKEPGINVYSEIVWFEHNKGFSCLMARLTSPEKLEEFLTNHKQEAKLGDIQKTEDISFVVLTQHNAVIAWRGKLLAVLYNLDSSEQLSFAQAKWVLAPESYNNTLSAAFEKTAPDIYYFNQMENTSVALKILAGKIRYEVNVFNDPIKTFSDFYSVNLADSKSSDSTLVLFTAQYLKKHNRFLEHYPDLEHLSNMGILNSSIAAGLTFYKQNDSAEVNIRVQPMLQGIEIPSSYQITNTGNVLFLADISSKTLSELNLPILPNNLPPFKRFVMLVEKNELGEKTSGTCYFEEKENLPLREITSFLLDSKILNLGN